ncbi:MAG: biopolymer transporter ExbD [Planctomycetota bacterium]|jgi:biopolymer transport protein ExbD|nr:MAG: biopolymer transporter ExbD [Planctomycetota bacterium]
MRLPGNKTRDYGDPMMAMVDVVFNLLIFFVVTAGGSPPEKLLPAPLPENGAVTTQVDPVSRKSWVTDVWLKLQIAGAENALQVDMNGTVYQDLKPLKAKLRALAELSPENPVVLDIAPSVQMEQLVDVWDTCIAAGFQSVSFAVDKPQSPPSAVPGVK